MTAPGPDLENRDTHRTDGHPWVMQLVVEVPKSAPPTRTAACQATAKAVLALLTHPATQSGGPWEEPVRTWAAGAFRKHTRRARGAAWSRIQSLPGVTFTTGGVRVRALVPTPVGGIYPAARKLQMSGTELGETDTVSSHQVLPDGPVVISISADPRLQFGKAAAAAGHAAQLTLATMAPGRADQWARAGFPLLVEHPDPAMWADLRQHSPVVIADAGLTDVAPGTVTATARWA